MPAPEKDALRHLRAAVAAAPDNVPLRQHLAEFLLATGRYEEAQREFREALSLAPQNTEVKLGLARAFHGGGKSTEALVLIESLLASPDTPAATYVQHARLLFAAGDVAFAVRQYKRGVNEDPEAADPDLEETLGIDAEPESSEVVDGRVRASHEGEERVSLSRIERPEITFDDVGGMGGVKDEIRMKIIHPLTKPEIFEAYGKKIGGGILLFGPPGCGKTFLARATAGEVKAGFLAVGISDVLEMWIGKSERNLHQIFEEARGNSPSVLFFDEVDALGASRTDMRLSAGRHLINQFLSELDGVASSNEGVLILAATNAPWHIDPAFRRPGRFDQVLFVPPPDAPARAEILRLHLRDKPVRDVDAESVAKKTAGYSGADLMGIVTRAVEAKIKDALRSGRPEAITTGDLLSAAKGTRPSTEEWFATARNYALYANQGGIYDEILAYLKMR